MKRAITAAALALALAHAHTAAHAQQLAGPQPDHDAAAHLSTPPVRDTGVTTARLVPGAVIGSAVGLIGGAAGGHRLGWGGGDDPGLIGVLVFGAAGSVVGTAAGVQLMSEGRVQPGSALLGSLAGAVTGVLGAAAFSYITAGSMGGGGVVIGFSTTQGITSAAISAAITRRAESLTPRAP